MRKGRPPGFPFLCPISREQPSLQISAMPMLTGPALKHIAAVVCLVVGVIGLAVPVLPGFPSLLLGFKLLGRDHWLTRKATGLWQRFRARTW